MSILVQFFLKLIESIFVPAEAVKEHGRVEVWLHSYLNSALDKCRLHVPAASSSRKTPLGAAGNEEPSGAHPANWPLN